MGFRCFWTLWGEMANTTGLAKYLVDVSPRNRETRTGPSTIFHTGGSMRCDSVFGWVHQVIRPFTTYPSFEHRDYYLHHFPGRRMLIVYWGYLLVFVLESRNGELPNNFHSSYTFSCFQPSTISPCRDPLLFCGGFS